MTTAEKVDKRIAELSDWQAALYRELRDIVNKSDPDIKEEWKWNTLVWTAGHLVCAVSAFKTAVKINFFQGALLNDPGQLINNGLDSKEHRAIDFHEGETIDRAAVSDLVKQAVTLAKAK